MNSAQLTMFSRDGCHLCEDMFEQLTALQQDYDFQINVIDISGDPHLEDQFGQKVPVLTYQDKEICHYYLDVANFKSLMKQSIYE